MKTLRVTLADIIGPTGVTGESTATVHARYVDTSGRGRDVHLTDGTIVVPVRRSVTPGTGPEEFDFVVIPSDDGDVREADQGFLTEVSWTVTAPEGGKSHGVRRVLVPSTADDPVQLGSLYEPTAIPAVTAQRVISGGTPAEPIYIIKIRGGTSAEWTAENPVLALGERGQDVDTGEERIGNGVDPWSLLPSSADFATQASGSALAAAGSASAARAAAGDAAWDASAASVSAGDALGFRNEAAQLLADAEAFDLTEGTATTGAAGSAMAFTVTGTAPNKVLNLTIPRGDTGNTGPANTLAKGTATTGAAGTSMDFTITGTAPNQTLNLTIPRGDTGNPSDYELRGTGSPEGVVTAPVGVYYTDTAITNGAMRWAKKTGTGNTGWTVVDGDTGRRNITATFPGWGGNLYLQRVNEKVYVTGTISKADSNLPGSVPNVFPSGFTPRLESRWIGYGFNSAIGDIVVQIIITAGGLLAVNRVSGASWTSPQMTSVYFPTLIFTTIDAWPATLPGFAS